ncbi:hypothetical protein BASA81_007904 [Batrachochytrium salamandrivorans]|nr:hypothetical protein BASA81_007904 [Batrachochytrium salamandrivorans]
MRFLRERKSDDNSALGNMKAEFMSLWDGMESNGIYTAAKCKGECGAEDSSANVEDFEFARRSVRPSGETAHQYHGKTGGRMAGNSPAPSHDSEAFWLECTMVFQLGDPEELVELTDLLDEGSSGAVFQGMFQSQPCAIKVIPGLDNPELFAEITHEISLLRRVGS